MASESPNPEPGRSADSTLAALARLAAVTPEGPGRGELAELVADHVLGHVQLDEVPPVMDGEVLADELGHDGAGAGPGLDRLAVPGVLGLVHLLEQPLDDVRALLQRASHGSPVPDPSGSMAPRRGAMISCRLRTEFEAFHGWVPTAGP